MTGVINSTVAAEQVDTPYETGQVAAQWLANHADRVAEAITSGELPLSTSSRIYTYWPVDEIPSPRCLVTIRYNGPPPESDGDLLNRHFQEIAADMATHPPIP